MTTTASTTTDSNPSSVREELRKRVLTPVLQAHRQKFPQLFTPKHGDSFATNNSDNDGTFLTMVNTESAPQVPSTQKRSRKRSNLLIKPEQTVEVYFVYFGLILRVLNWFHRCSHHF